MTEPVLSEALPQPIREIQVFARCLTGRFLVFWVSERVTCSLLVSTLSSLTGVPSQLFYLTLDGRRLSHDSETVVHIVSGQTVRMHGRLRGGASPAGGLVETEWFCATCKRGGCWPTKQRCFRCNLPRVESDRMRGISSFPAIGGKGKGQQMQQREMQFLGRAPLPGPQFSTAPTWRPPKKAKKSTAEAPPPLTPHVDVVGLLRGLGCSEAVLAEVQGRLAPEPKARTPGARALKLAEMETALHKAKRHELILMEQLEVQERKVATTKASIYEKSQKVANLEAEVQEAKRLVVGSTPQGSEVGEGAGEDERALSVESDDELAGGLVPDDDMGLPQEFWEDHEPNKRPRMVAKPKATSGPSNSQGFGPPADAEHALNMLSGFEPNQLALLVHAAQIVQGRSSSSPVLMLMLGVPVGNNVVEDGEQWKLVFRRKRKTLLKLFKIPRIRLSLHLGLLVSLLVCQVPSPYRRPDFLQISLFLLVSFFIKEMPSVLFGLLAVLERTISRMR